MPPKTKKLLDLVLRPESSRRPPQKMSPPPVLPTRRRLSTRIKRRLITDPPTTAAVPHIIDSPSPADSGREDELPNLGIEEVEGEIEYLQPGECLPRSRPTKPRGKVQKRPAAVVPSPVADVVVSAPSVQTRVRSSTPSRSVVPPPPLSVVPLPSSSRVASQESDTPSVQPRARSSCPSESVVPPPPLLVVPLPTSSRAASQESDTHPDEDNPSANVEVVRSIRVKHSGEGIAEGKLVSQQVELMFSVNFILMGSVTFILMFSVTFILMFVLELMFNHKFQEIGREKEAPSMAHDLINI